MTRRKNPTIDEHKARGERAALTLPKKFSDLVVPVQLDDVKVRKGRRRDLTSEEVNAFCRALDTPMTFEVACGVIGVPERTMRDWLGKGSDPDCEDAVLLELSAKYAAVMSGGNRRALTNVVMEHAIDDPKMAKYAAELFIPGANIAKNMKMDVSVEAKVQDRTPWHLATPDEMRILEAARRIEERLRSLG